MLSPDARNEWLTILGVGALLTAAAVFVGLWWLSVPILIVAVALAAFFRDPERRIPTQRGALVAPADGRISSIHELEHYEPLGGPAVCVRIFLSVLDVHINRSPCHGEVVKLEHTPGQHLNALNPESAEVNESNLIVMVHPIRRYPIAAVRQVAGALARTVVCKVREGQVVQRGERIGLIKLGSTTELYLPKEFEPQVTVEAGQKVQGGRTVLATMGTPDREPASTPATPGSTPAPKPAEPADTKDGETSESADEKPAPRDEAERVET
ncbi:MAG: phosphatidylserine decarboxylase [Phycisphaeraceae bacterium]